MKDPVPVTGVGIPDKYIGQATQEEQREECGLSKESILRLFEEIFAEIWKKIQKVLEIKN